MGTQRVEDMGPKPSFADIVAGPTPTRNLRRNGPTLIGQEPSNPPDRAKNTTIRVEQQQPFEKSAPLLKEDINGAMSHLEVKDTPTASDAPHELSVYEIKTSGATTDEERTHISSSTTGRSHDAKSATSGTTFAFDERESLRPDDSASVQAADDDCAGSGPLSGAPNSRLGSEAGSRHFGNQANGVHPTAPQADVPAQTAEASNNDRVVKDPTVSNGTNPSINTAQLQVIAQPIYPMATRAPIPFGDLHPDAKLFEALESSKDRIFLLRLESNIIEFIKDSAQKKIQLPPCNSFCRLLAHKLADYYALSHVVDNAQNAITLFKTPYCRMPTPLGELARDIVHEAMPGPVIAIPAMTIMRRPDLAKDGQALSSGAPTTESSLVPSKAGSEAGDETKQGAGTPSPPESMLIRDKVSLTLAQREARYREKREQIFGPQSENNENNEALNEASRVSSRNEERKRKKKNKVANDDFEARSQFNAYYPVVSYGTGNPYAQTVNTAPTYGPYPFLPPVQQPAPSAYMSAIPQQPVYNQQIPNHLNPQAYPAPQVVNPVAPFGHQFGFPGYEHQHNQQYYPQMPPQQMPHHMVPSQPSSTLSSPSIDGHGAFHLPNQMNAEMQTSRGLYQQHYYPANYQQQHNRISGPQLYGQTQEPPYAAPGNLTNSSGMYRARHAPFDPNTRSFIPNGNTIAWTRSDLQNVQPINNRSPAKLPEKNGQPIQPPLCTPATNPISKENNPINPMRKQAAQKDGTNSPTTNSLSKWGTPANLPPKPPPPEAPSMPDSLPPNNQFTPNIQPVTAGQPMPNYQNGVYSMPRTGR